MSKDFETKLSILVIATNQYKQFVPDLLDSINKNIVINSTIEILLFTDEINLSLNNKFSEKILVKQFAIESFGWPDATLLRYKIFENHWQEINGEIVMYMDVDTVVTNQIVWYDFIKALDNKGVALVAHAGYFKRPLPIQIVQKLSKGIGWETNRKSTAYVPLRKRKTYVCGGVWFGKNMELKKMVKKLRENVESDLIIGYVAKFHDESHLNKWLTENRKQLKILTPNWAYAPKYKKIKNLKPIITVLEKNIEFKKLKK